MKRVSRFEANLLHLLHYFLQRVPTEQAVPLLDETAHPPRGLSRNALDLVQETLAKGCMRWLVHVGGWQSGRFLRDGRVVEGRLWQRTPPQDLGLTFSRNTLRFLIWVTAYNPLVEKSSWVERDMPLTVGDQLVLFLAYSALRHPERGHPLRQRLPFRRHGLCWLAYPADFGGLPDATPDHALWTSGLGACIVEALQPWLASRWIELERAKRGLTGWQKLQDVGDCQERAVVPFLETVEAGGRRDLARFLLQASSVLLTEEGPAGFGSDKQEGAGPRLADRARTFRALLFLPRQVGRFRQWEQEARAIGYLDEGYGASQFWKAEWERWQGEALYTRAQAIIRELDPLAQT
jgi:hypothetical protein